MAWYPNLCSWIQDADSSAQTPEAAYLSLHALLEPILVSRLHRYGVHFHDTDIDNCRDTVFGRMERKLAEPMEFIVKLAERRQEQPLPEIFLLGSAVSARFMFALDPEARSEGYRVRLRTSEKVVWEDFPVETSGTSVGALSVHVPATRLDHGRSYTLELTNAGAGDPIAMQEFHVIRVIALHLLKAGSYSILGQHADLDPQAKYAAEFREMDARRIRVGGLICSEERRVSVSMPYESLLHERDTHFEVWPENQGSSQYSSCVRAVRHESLGSRRAFVTQVARNVAYEHFRTNQKARVRSLENLPASEVPRSADESQRRVAVLLAKRVLERLPERTRLMLIEHEVDGEPWSEIAKRFGISEAKAKQDVSRALTLVSKAFLPREMQNSSSAVQRFVGWIKESLDLLVSGRSDKL